jgi:copper(I)-binding protein
LRHSALSAACLALLVCAIAGAQPAALTVQDAWVRATPGSDVAAAYLTLHNSGTQPVTIVGVRSARARHAMIHETTVNHGQSAMRPREPLRIGGGETLRFAPGGLHIMLQDLVQPLAPGDEVTLELLLDGGASVKVSAHVRALADA